MSIFELCARALFGRWSFFWVCRSCTVYSCTLHLVGCCLLLWCVIMAFETAFKSFSQDGPDYSVDFYREFYVQHVRAFETLVVQKLRNINHPRRSFSRPDRSIRLDDVHQYTFVESLGKKMLGSEIRHQPPRPEKLLYEVCTLERWVALVGGDNIHRSNDAKDWSLLTPLGRICAPCPADLESLPVGALVVPLRELEGSFEVFRPSPDFAVSPLFGESKSWPMIGCVYVCVCHNEKKVPDEWKARQATQAILCVCV